MEVCHICRKVLKESDRYFIKQQKAYCTTCYEKILSIRCSGCGKAIFGDKLSAMDKDWHPDHFKCSFCQKVIEDDTFVIFQEQPVCNVCKNSKNPPQSAAVKRCKECNQPLLGIKYYILNTDNYCEPCYQKTGAPKCQNCKEAILGKWITANDKTWHAEHFLCYKCNDSLIGRPFSFNHGQLMCVPCFKKYVLHKPTTPKPMVDRETLDRDNDDGHSGSKNNR